MDIIPFCGGYAERGLFKKLFLAPWCHAAAEPRNPPASSREGGKKPQNRKHENEWSCSPFSKVTERRRGEIKQWRRVTLVASSPTLCLDTRRCNHLTLVHFGAKFTETQIQQVMLTELLCCTWWTCSYTCINKCLNTHVEEWVVTWVTAVNWLWTVAEFSHYFLSFFTGFVFSSKEDCWLYQGNWTWKKPGKIPGKLLSFEVISLVA